MNKQEFLAQLREGLNGLPQEDIDERIAFYGEMIDDRLEDGLTEEEAVEAIGTTDEVVAQIIADTPLTKLVKERVKPKRKLKVWEIVLIAAGSPVWVPLLIGAAAVAFALYVILWAIVVLLWTVDLALAVCLPGCAFSAALFFGQGYGASGFATLSAQACSAEVWRYFCSSAVWRQSRAPLCSLRKPFWESNPSLSERRRQNEQGEKNLAYRRFGAHRFGHSAYGRRACGSRL